MSRQTQVVKWRCCSPQNLSNINITESDYISDGDFGLLYRAIKTPKELSQDEEKKTKARKSQYYLNGGLLWHICPERDVICIPKGIANNKEPDIRTRLMIEHHDSAMAGHRGVHSTYLHLRRRYTWPKMSKDVEKFVSSCEECQASKKGRQLKAGKVTPLQNPITHGTHYSMDFLTDLPKSSAREYDTCLVIIDRFSKRSFLIPTWKTADSEVTADLVFQHVVKYNGTPLEIVSDRDPKFTSNFWRTLWARMGTGLRMSSARSQSTDGQTERAIAVVEEILRTGINYKQDNWVDLLPGTEFAMNNSVAASTGMTPFFTETGRHPLMPVDVGFTIDHALAITRSRGNENKVQDTANKNTGPTMQYIQRIQASHLRAREALEKAKLRMMEQ